MANVNANIMHTMPIQQISTTMRTGSCSPESCEIDTEQVPVNEYINNPKGAACCKFFYVTLPGHVDKQFFLDRGVDKVIHFTKDNKKFSDLIFVHPCKYLLENKCIKYPERSYSCKVGPIKLLKYIKGCSYKFINYGSEKE